MKKKNKIGLINWVIFVIVILCSFYSGWLVRDEMGWTAKMPEHDTPPPEYKGQEKACTTEWKDNEKIVKCKMYKVLEINE